MADNSNTQPFLDIFPHIDITDNVADGLVLPMQNADIFGFLHETSHRGNTLFRIAHVAVASTSSLAIEDNRQNRALMFGCEVYEVVSTAVRTQSQNSEVATEEEYETITRVINSVLAEGFVDRASYAAEQLTKDAPILQQAIREIAARKLGHNTMVDYAIAGAGIMRGMQIFTDRQLAA